MDAVASPFGFSSTAADVVAGVDLVGKRVVVTGGGRGSALRRHVPTLVIGAEVTLAVGITAAAAPIVAEIIASTDNRAADLADRASVAAIVATARPLDFFFSWSLQDFLRCGWCT